LFSSSTQLRDAALENFLIKEAKEVAKGTNESVELKEFLHDNNWAIEYTDKVTFTKKHGSETITVDISVNREEAPEEDKESEEEAVEGLETQADHFSVNVSKDNKSTSLHFKCSAIKGYLEISDIEVLNSEGEVEHSVPMSEIDPAGQENLWDYLAKRGIANEFCRWVFIAVNEFDDHEYIEWLKAVKNFLN